MYFIDINGLGRLAYLICADFNDEDLISVCSVLHADFIFVSAYTNDTKLIQSMSLETKEHKQRLIDIFVNAVYLYDDKLVITFNYKEASKTVTLKEVNGSIIECSGAPNSKLDL